MNRFLIASAIALATLPSLALAQPAPTPAELDQAKKAYAEGKALHDQGKLLESVSKFQESYRLSKKPTLLYNIAVTMEEAGEKDLALVYYRKFLADAPADAPQRPEVTTKVAALEKALNVGGSGTPTVVTPPPTEVKPDPGEHKTGPVKPAGFYKESDFQHIVVEDAPPGKPLDVSASIPEDSGWTVTLYFRGAGDASFTAKPMKWHYKQLIARIPANKVSGSSIQYYVEARDQANKEVARAGKSTSPNLVNLDATATAHVFPDFTDDSAGVVAGGGEPKRHGDNEDPFNKGNVGGGSQQPIEQPIEQPVGGDGLMDPGSKKFKYLRYGTTIGAAAFLAGSLVLYLAASSQGSNLVDDSKSCGVPPCRAFDSTDQAFQDAGHSRQTLARITFGVGVVGAVVAGYFWYRELHGNHGDTVAAKPASTGLDSLMFAPVAGDGFMGAAAAARF